MNLPPRTVTAPSSGRKAAFLDHQTGHVTIGNQLDLDRGLVVLPGDRVSRSRRGGSHTSTRPGPSQPLVKLARNAPPT